MAKGLEDLEKMEYPGRVIIIGKSPQGDDIAMYAITGRSPSSQARKLENDESRNQILVKPTDEETLKSGDPELLIYPAIIVDEGIAVSNGKQTVDINPHMKTGTDPVDVLEKAMLVWDYEPDEPNYTPRISGCIFNGAALSIIKRAENGSAIKNYYKIDPAPGKGKLIATYTGINENPLPSFAGEPLDVDLNYSSANEAAEAMYEALGPEGSNDDFRVAAAALYRNAEGRISIAIKNRCEL